MAVKASPEIIREMRRDISTTMKDLERISGGIRSAMPSTSGWDDAQAAEFKMLMERIARLTATPIETLHASMPRLEKLAQSLDRYNEVKF
ncbi:MAG: hypothetical protein LUC98_01800 [Lachnospiraceae bacterium]|nr:hypothetical protein [Lachnospiraceae bacterium]